MADPQYKVGTSARVDTVIRNTNDILLDPTSVKITITHSVDDTKVVDNEDMIKISVGKYYYIYQSTDVAAVGYYDILIVAVSGGYTIKKQQLKDFELVA